MTDMEERKFKLIHAAINMEIAAMKFSVMEVPKFKQIVLKHVRENKEQEKSMSDTTARRYMKRMNIITERQYQQILKGKIGELKNLSIEEICQKYNLSVGGGDTKENQKENPEKDEVIVKSEEAKSSSSSNRKRKRESDKMQPF